MLQETGPVTPEPPEKPVHLPTSQPEKPLSKADQRYAFLLKSPFAKMFARSGAEPTVREMKMIIDNILKQVMAQIKKDDAEWKKNQQRMKRMLEGKG